MLGISCEDNHRVEFTKKKKKMKFKKKSMQLLPVNYPVSNRVSGFSSVFIID